MSKVTPSETIHFQAEEPEEWTNLFLVPAEGSIFVFGEDPRPDANEILNSIQKLHEHGIEEVEIIIDGKKVSAFFWGDVFFCPFETTISDHVGIRYGHFYRCDSDGGFELTGKFPEISFSFLSQLNEALKLFILGFEAV